MRSPVVILVEDDSNDELFALRAINASGIACKTIVLRSGQEALEYVNRKGKYAERTYYELPDLFLIDVRLGSISGFNVLHDIRQDAELHLVPVVMLSNSDEANDVRMAYELGASGYLRKLVGLEEMNAQTRCTLRYWLVVNVKFRGAPSK